MRDGAEAAVTGSVVGARVEVEVAGGGALFDGPLSQARRRRRGRARSFDMGEA